MRHNIHRGRSATPETDAVADLLCEANFAISTSAMNCYIDDTTVRVMVGKNHLSVLRMIEGDEAIVWSGNAEGLVKAVNQAVSDHFAEQDAENPSPSRMQQTIRDYADAQYRNERRHDCAVNSEAISDEEMARQVEVSRERMMWSLSTGTKDVIEAVLASTPIRNSDGSRSPVTTLEEIAAWRKDYDLRQYRDTHYGPLSALTAAQQAIANPGTLVRLDAVDRETGIAHGRVLFGIHVTDEGAALRVPGPDGDLDGVGSYCLIRPGLPHAQDPGAVALLVLGQMHAKHPTLFPLLRLPPPV